MNEKEVMAKAIAQSGALQFGLFKDGRGEPIPYYLDLARLWSEPAWLRLGCDMIETLVRQQKDLEFDRIGGADFTGLPLATMIAQKVNRPLMVLRRRIHLSKGESPFLGNLFPGERVLVIDDVIATGAKASDIIGLTRIEGGLISAYVVLLDKQQGGSSILATKQVSLLSALRISEVAEILFKMGWLDDEKFSALLSSLAGADQAAKRS